MVIFINEDRGYLNWVKQHRNGYVLEARRASHVSHCVIHRAVCAQVKQSAAHKHVHWTTGTKFKACGLDREELIAWSSQETGLPARNCDVCQPEVDLPLGNGEMHLSRQNAEVLDYVLEAALIHLEKETPPYRLSITNIAACFNKSPGQIALALRRLVDDDFVSVNGGLAIGSAVKQNRVVMPTLRAMRTLEAFRDESDTAIELELAKLRTESKEH